ncbi:MAG TPA: hypothetical protein VIC82_00590 [Candidatus Nanopelagicales bacterium]|jgi:hypothetical protein
MSTHPVEDPLQVLRRWEDSGAIWRVVRRTPDTLEIALLTCTAREEMGRITTSDPEVLAFVGDRTENG